MNAVIRITFIFSVLMLMVCCATVPTGPSVMVMPTPGKPFDLFQAEDNTCRQWARQQIGLTPQETINQNTASGAAIGTVVGAGLGAAIGAATGNAGGGAVIGAAGGLLVGTASGADAGRYYGYEAQRRYDIAYQQCMFANGNLVPGVRYYRVRGTPPPPPPGTNYAPSDLSRPKLAPPPPPAP